MIYELLMRPLLFSMDPENAHDAASRVMELAGSTALGRGLIRSFYGAPSRPVEAAGLRFANPVGLAAGFDKSCRLAAVLPCFGFGFIELGTLTWRAQPGNPKPRIFRIQDQRAILNRLGFNNPGALEAARRLSELRRRPVPIGLNIGKSAAASLDEAAEDYLKSLGALYPYGDYFAFNISSPNTADLRRLHEAPRLAALLDALCVFRARQASAKPFFLKISPDLEPDQLEALVPLCVERGVGLIASNTTVSRAALGPEWREQAGGLSGAPLKAAALELTRRLRGLSGGKVPLIGVGGIFGPQDARERLEAGADLVQVYTGWVYEGPGLVRRIVGALA